MGGGHGASDKTVLSEPVVMALDNDDTSTGQAQPEG